MSTRPCRECGAQIIWITSRAGKPIPCDFSPVYYKNKGAGKARVVTLSGDVISCELTKDRERAEGYGYVPHWSSCTAPGKFRKGG